MQNKIMQELEKRLFAYNKTSSLSLIIGAIVLAMFSYIAPMVFKLDKDYTILLMFLIIGISGIVFYIFNILSKKTYQKIKEIREKESMIEANAEEMLNRLDYDEFKEIQVNPEGVIFLEDIKNIENYVIKAKIQNPQLVCVLVFTGPSQEEKDADEYFISKDEIKYNIIHVFENKE